MQPRRWGDAVLTRLRDFGHWHGSSHELALGAALGIFMATTPFFGAQIAGAATLAWLLGGNVPIAIVATFWANPFTCPLLWIGSYRIGAWLLGIDDPVTVDDLVRGFGEVAGSLPLHGQHAITVAHSLLAPILKPFGIGAFALGLISAAIAYPVVRLILDRLQAGNLGRAKPADLGLA